MKSPIKVEIDGRKFENLDQFYDAVVEAFRLPDFFGRNLDAFDDVLRGGFGHLDYDEPFELVWIESVVSRQVLGYQETARHLSKMLATCHPSNVPSIKRRLENARRGVGPTLFDEILDIIRLHRHVTLALK